MEPKYPIVVSASAIQTTLFAALRITAVLIGGVTAVLGFVGKRDLSGLIAYVQSSDFVAVAGALAAVISFGYGLWHTYRQKSNLVTVAKAAPDSVATVVDSAAPSGTTLGSLLPIGLLVIGMAMLAGCATLGTDVRLNTNKAFLTAQIAFKSSQQTVLSVCSVPVPAKTTACGKAIDLLHTGAQAEAAGFTAQQAGNSADLQTAILTLTNLPAQLVALGVLEAN